MYQFLKNLDPHRPVFVNWSPRIALWNLDHSDLMAYDYYSTPISATERTIDRHNAFDDAARRLATGAGKPFLKWMELDHGCTELGVRLMRPEEERCVMYLSLVNGARAISFFNERPWNDDVWEILSLLGAEVECLTPVLCAPDGQEEAVSGDDEARVLLKKYNGTYWLFVVNASAREKAVSVRFRKNRFFPDVALFEQAPAMREMALRPMGTWDQGALILTLESYGVRVFAIQESIPLKSD